jgi:hypothetical protein
MILRTSIYNSIQLSFKLIIEFVRPNVSLINPIIRNGARHLAKKGPTKNILNYVVKV